MRSAANSSAARSAAGGRRMAAAISSAGTAKLSPPAGDQPSKRDPYSRRAASPSDATRAQISWTAARCSAKSERSSRRRDAGESSHEPTSKRLTGTVEDPSENRVAPAPHKRLDRLGARFQARLVRHESRGRRAENARDAEAVLTERASGGREVDDAVDQADLRRELHRPVELHHLDRLASGVEPGRGRPWVFGGDPQQRGPCLGTRELGALGHGEHEPARAEPQIDQLVVPAV